MSLKRTSHIAVLICLFGGIFIVTIMIHFHEKILHQHYDDCQEKILQQKYQFEFVQMNIKMDLHLWIEFELKDFCDGFHLKRNVEQHVDSENIQLFHHGTTLPVEIHFEQDQILVETKKRLRPGNYSFSMLIRFNLTDVEQRIFFSNLQSFPHFSDSSVSQPTFKLNFITTDQIIVANIPLNQSVFNVTHDQIAFVLLRQYQCRSMDLIQICLPDVFSSSIDLYSHLFNLIEKTQLTFETFFSQSFPHQQLSLVSVDEYDRRILSYPGLVFVNQNHLLFNGSVEQMIEQRSFIYELLAEQWFETIKFFNTTHQWFRTSLAKSIGQHLYSQNNETTMERSSTYLERHMSNVMIDAFCNVSITNDRHQSFRDESLLIIEKVEVFLTEYRLFIGDFVFRSRIRSLLHSSNQTLLNISTFLFPEINPSSFIDWTRLSGHPALFLNDSMIKMHLFKFDSNCSQTISTIISPINFRFFNDSFSSMIHFNHQSTPIVMNNPFIHLFIPSMTHLMEEIKSLRSTLSSSFLNRLLFESFLFNLANQISIDYPLDLLKLIFFHHQLIDWSIVYRIVQWYRLMIVDVRLNEKFHHFLRTMVQPFCPNQFWSKHLLNELKSSSQQLNDEILFDFCCLINHSICLQYLSNNPDPQILLQSIFHSQVFDLTLKNLSINANRSFLLYSDRFVRSIVCQIVRQQNDKYWYELIELLREKSLTPSITTALACALRTDEQIDFYLSHLCPSIPSRWFCLTNILRYAPVQIAQRRLNDIDNEHWPSSTHHLLDFLFVIGRFQGDFSNKAIIREFRLLLTNWTKRNEQTLLQWFENQHA